MSCSSAQGRLTALCLPPLLCGSKDAPSPQQARPPCSDTPGLAPGHPEDWAEQIRCVSAPSSDLVIRSANSHYAGTSLRHKPLVINSEIPSHWFPVSHSLLRVEVTPVWGGTYSLCRDVVRTGEWLW